MKMIVKMRDS